MWCLGNSLPGHSYIKFLIYPSVLFYQIHNGECERNNSGSDITIIRKQNTIEED